MSYPVLRGLQLSPDSRVARLVYRSSIVFGMNRKCFREGRLKAFKVISKALLPAPSKAFDHKGVSRILIYGAMGIGNMIMFTPTLKAIRRGFPNAHITLLVAQSGCEEVVEGTRLVDEVIRAKVGRWEGWKLARYIRRQHFDLLVSSFHGLAFVHVTVFSGIPWRVGHCSSPGWESKYDFLYNVQVRMEKDEHEIDRGTRLAQTLRTELDDDHPVMPVSAEDRQFAKNFLTHNKVSSGDVVVGIQVGSWRGQQWKRWRPDRLAQVCDQLIERYGIKVIILGSPEHNKELQEFLPEMRYQPMIALGKATLKQSAAIMERCNFSICNDSGLMHVSAAVGTPVIAIYGPTDHHRTSPCRYGNEHIVLRKELPCSPCFRMGDEDTVKNCMNHLCLDAIMVKDVIDAADRMMARKA